MLCSIDISQSEEQQLTKRFCRWMNGYSFSWRRQSWLIISLATPRSRVTKCFRHKKVYIGEDLIQFPHIGKLKAALAQYGLCVLMIDRSYGRYLDIYCGAATDTDDLSSDEEKK